MSGRLDIAGLRVMRGDRLVLQVDALHVENGETLAVIGPNGAGKSTLLLALSRLLPFEGSIRLNDKELTAFPALEYRRKLALVLQDPLLLDTKVDQNVALGLRFRGLPRKQIQPRVHIWLDRLGVGHLQDRHARQLSGGEAQRVSLARAFAIEPELLLLDEPFSALDNLTRLRLLEDLRQVLRLAGMTTLFITHDLNEALLLGDKVAVILDGQLRQSGLPQEVFSTPSDPQVAAFVGVETIIPGQVTAAHNGLLVIQTAAGQVEAVGEANPGRQVFVCLRPEDITLWTDLDPFISSARNRIRGRILRCTPQGPLERVVVDCGFNVTALVTRASALEMGLQEGVLVQATFKTSAVHVLAH